MEAAIRYYKKYIVENKNLIFVTIVIALIFRVCVYMTSTPLSLYPYTPGLLWSEPIDIFFKNNKDISALFSILFTIIIVLCAGYLNTKHKLIRSRTYLTYVFCILFFSSHPAYIFMGPQYIATLLFVICTDLLLDSFQQNDSSGKAFSIGFFIALASLFTPSAILYILLFWIGFGTMKSLKIKTIITLLFGIISVYWIVFFYYLWQKNLDSFLEPFYHLLPIFSPFIENINISTGIILFFCISFLLTAMISYLNNSYKDKIQTRVNLYFTYIAAAFSLLSFVFINDTPILHLFIFSYSSSLLLSHFFSLNLEKWKVSLFYLAISLYFITSIYVLFDSVIFDMLTG